MLSASRGSIALVTGIAAVLLSGVLFALFRSWMVVPVVTEPTTSVNPILTEATVVLPVGGSYQALIPPVPTSTVTRSRQRWQVQQETARPVCQLFEGVDTSSTSVGAIDATWCELTGASIEGRYVHVLSGTNQPTCALRDVCEQAPAATWSVYDLRTSTLRPVPAPFRDGAWQAVDAIRSIGLFRGVVRSTLQAQSSDFWTLTDVAGAAFWNGQATDIDSEAVTVLPQRLVSRPNGNVILSYLAIDAQNQATLRLRVFTAGTWQAVTVPEALTTRVWRLTSWESSGRGGKAVVTWIDDAQKNQTMSIVTP